MKDRPSTVRDPMGVLVGNRALKQGLVTAEQFKAALAQQQQDFRTGKQPRRLSEVLVGMNALTLEQVSALEADVIKEAPAQPPTAFVLPKPYGKYDLRRELGRGGMGIVYEARDTVLDRVVALKLLRKDSSSDPEVQATNEQRFLQEARLAAQLPKHPHIVGVYEAGLLDSLRYIAMEYVDGRDFVDWRVDVSPRRQIALLAKVCRAVHHAHEHGVIHRDLKPANILIDASGEPHVTDFGLARRAVQEITLTAPELTVGTPAYMAPEQARGLRSVDRRADVYSLGVLLYEIITDRTPFEGETAVDLLVRAAQEPLPKPSEVAPDKPLAKDAALEAACLRALAKKPEDRYPTALALAEALDQWGLGSGPPTVRKRPATVRVLVVRKSSKWVALAAVAATLAAVALVLLLLRDRGGAPPSPTPVVDPAYAEARRVETMIADLRRRIDADPDGQEKAAILAALDAAAKTAGARAGEVASLRSGYEERFRPKGPPGQVGHWPFEEDDGTGVPIVAGKVGKAARFDGSGKFIELPRTEVLDRLQESDYAIAAWFRPDEAPTGKDPEDNSAWAIVVKGGWNEGLHYIAARKFVMQHWQANAKWSGTGTWPDEYPIHRWYHVVGVVDHGARTTSIYVNGHHRGTQKWADGSPFQGLRDKPWRIGIANPDGKDRRWAARGAIDEVRLFNRALSADDVKALYEVESRK